MAMQNFERAVKKEQLAISKRRRPSRNIGNISHGQWNMIKSLKDNNRFIVVQGDKNLGTCFLERKQYIERRWTEHLSNNRNYIQLMAINAHNQIRRLVYKINDWLGRYRPRRERAEPVDYDCISESRGNVPTPSNQKNMG